MTILKSVKNKYVQILLSILAVLAFTYITSSLPKAFDFLKAISEIPMTMKEINSVTAAATEYWGDVPVVSL